MIQSSKVLWGEGLFLRPQHFQRQDAYHEWRSAEFARILHPYAWGVRRVSVDVDALATGTLRFRELQLVFPDGEIYSAPGDEELPPAVSLASLPAGTSDFVYHAALASLRAHGGNFTAIGKPIDGGVRYVQRNLEAEDWFTDAASAEVAVLKRSLRILASEEPRDHLVSLPVCRIRRSTSGAFELDDRFIAPSLSIAASVALQSALRRLIEILQAKVNALYGFHREPSRHVIEFRSGDIASFWLLHTASAAFASLSHLHMHPELHPERLFERMLELAGALMTFSKIFTLADLPAYRHDDPEKSFLRLDEIVIELLETVISTRYFSIALTEVKPSFLQGRLDSDKITAGTSLYLGVQATLPPAELVEAVPMRFKIGAPDDVEKLVLSAMSGIRLTHAPQVPAAIPVRPGAYYFALDGRSSLFERMLQAKTIALYTPSGIADLEVELFALNA